MLTGAWIVALFLAGAPLAAMALDETTERDGDETDPAGEDALTEDRQDLVDPASDADSAADAGEGEEEAVAPTDFEFILGSGGDHLLEGFRPGTDTLTLTSDTWDFDLYGLNDKDTGAALEITLGEERAILRFPGLDAVPVDDVFLDVTEPGAEPERVALRDALLPEDDRVLAPTQPDAPDRLPEGASYWSPIAPADPDARDDVPEETARGEVLAPTDPDALDDPLPVRSAR
jgi:hypothetical protein